MADFTLGGWPAGATVTVHVKPTTPGQALGAAVDSEVAAAGGTVTFTGLTEGQSYVAASGSRQVSFLIASESSSSGGSVDTATLVGYCEWDGSDWTFDGAVILSRPAFDGKLIWTGGDASTDDPSSMMGVGDLWYPESE